MPLEAPDRKPGSYLRPNVLYRPLGCHSLSDVGALRMSSDNGALLGGDLDEIGLDEGVEIALAARHAERFSLDS
jgi:hypothetical protein